MALSETQWVIVGLMVLAALAAGGFGYLWNQENQPAHRHKKNAQQVLEAVPFPAPTKNQEWSYGHSFVPEQEAPPHDPGHAVESGAPLTADYCRWGTTPVGVVEGENALRYFSIYTVVPSMYNLKYYKTHL